MRLFFAIGCLVSAAAQLSGLPSIVGMEPDFDRQVAPILAGRCLDCHSGPEPQGKLDLSRASKALAGGESGPAIVKGHTGESILWQRIEAGEMPPKHPLPAEERAILKAWISAGASWGTDPIDPFRYTSAARAGYDWWSLQSLKPAQPPIVHDSSWPRSNIDRFILAALEARSLKPSRPAERRQLIRRLYFDLIGLPPSRDELDDPTPIRQIVEKLLASHHYGERWARHWLDIAHYGESDGFEYDRMRPHAWRYRDWVIDALNRDLPYDEFSRLQIAGDVLKPGDEAALIATGFLVGGAHDSLLPKGEVMQMIMRQDELEDLVSLVGQTFLGLTVNCARCHDHKFDPIRQTDYYRLAAALAGVKRGNRDIPLTPPQELIASHQRVSQELEAIMKTARDLARSRRQEAASNSTEPPQPIARWEFKGDVRDSVGTLHGTLRGAAKATNEGLVLDGKNSFVAAGPLPRDLTEKTLEAWVQLDRLDQRSGGVIGVETLDGRVFDTIVFGEKEPKRWIAGSNNFERTQSIEKAADETEAAKRAVHLAAVYSADGSIQLYRDGQPYGKSYTGTGPARFISGHSHVIFGLRHLPAGGNKMLAGRIERAQLYDRALTDAEIAASAAASPVVSEAELLAELRETERSHFQQLQADVARLTSQLQVYRDRKAFAVTPQPAPVIKVLARGNVLQPGDAISAGGILCLEETQPDFSITPDANDAERRIKLGQWIANDKNPLFARTIVNRIWQHHFGRGLIETTSDLGFSGGQPTHPELLDWLASELIARRWSLKELHKLIVMSATYQQASRPREEGLAIDADNRLLWRYSPRRLDAESVRDAMLASAGQLNRAQGGPSVMDFRPFVYKNTQYYEAIDPVEPEFQRRSIYRFWARGGRNPLLDAFDCPDPSTAAPRRASTTTPLQALALLNNAFTLRMADQFAQRLERERPGDAAQQVTHGFLGACGRAPSPAELQESQSFVEQHGLSAFCRVLLNSNSFLYVD